MQAIHSIGKYFGIKELSLKIKAIWNDVEQTLAQSKSIVTASIRDCYGMRHRKAVS